MTSPAPSLAMRLFSALHQFHRFAAAARWPPAIDTANKPLRGPKAHVRAQVSWSDIPIRLSSWPLRRSPNGITARKRSCRLRLRCAIQNNPRSVVIVVPCNACTRCCWPAFRNGESCCVACGRRSSPTELILSSRRASRSGGSKGTAAPAPCPTLASLDRTPAGEELDWICTQIRLRPANPVPSPCMTLCHAAGFSSPPPCRPSNITMTSYC